MHSCAERANILPYQSTAASTFSLLALTVEKEIKAELSLWLTRVSGADAALGKKWCEDAASCISAHG